MGRLAGARAGLGPASGMAAPSACGPEAKLQGRLDG